MKATVPSDTPTMSGRPVSMTVSVVFRFVIGKEDVGCVDDGNGDGNREGGTVGNTEENREGIKVGSCEGVKEGAVVAFMFVHVICCIEVKLIPSKSALKLSKFVLIYSINS